MEKKYAIVGAGYAIPAHLMQHLHDKGVVLFDAVDDIPEEDRYAIMPKKIELPPLSVYGDKPEKPTCERNHEYVERNTWEGTHIIHSHWECRFCGRPLK